MPDEVVDFFTVLAPGDMIVLTPAGNFAATVTAADSPLEGIIVSTGEDDLVPPMTEPSGRLQNSRRTAKSMTTKCPDRGVARYR
ncbi:hypothetical protein AB0I49_36875 [Streptomyces sp. NPDC050617]|uniref:hypothetical protein n=1 Tax=Streptomyces sp. NPDC050617 TaxID=3154628 RepID=UPI00341C9687